ncbi:MAG: hypothetical protein KAT77_06390 [Nanoarchaeota archaeon]|nr:hypothetical protein [Nanoarchaeota archaeon]
MSEENQYAKAGVNVDENDLANEMIGKLVPITFDENVVNMEGLFSAGYRIDREKGTFFGQELVPAYPSNLEGVVRLTLENIKQRGDQPLFMTDYLGFGKLKATKAAKIVLDIMSAGRGSDGFLSTPGGEVAEMPGVIRSSGAEIVIAITYQSKHEQKGVVNIAGVPGDVITASIDSVGTKTGLGMQTGFINGLFDDMIGHSVGDICVQFGIPLGLAVYVGHSPSFEWKDMKNVYETSVSRAELGNLNFLSHPKEDDYVEGQFDIVGSILGVVNESKLLTGKNIKESDLLIGRKCFGVNTNGYSLIRKLIDNKKIDPNEFIPGTDMTSGQAFMQPHENYQEETARARAFFGDHLKGAAHVTGGGIKGNTVRLLSPSLDASIHALPDNPVFKYLQEKGDISEVDMNKTYNRGIGVVYVVDKNFKTKNLPDRYMVIGNVDKR